MTIMGSPSIDDIDAQIAQLREQRKMLKKTGKAAERKVGTLARRRERLLARVREIDEQITAMRADVLPEVVVPRRRGRRPKSAQTVSG